MAKVLRFAEKSHPLIPPDGARLCKVSVTLSPGEPSEAGEFGATLRFAPTRSTVGQKAMGLAGEQTICDRHDGACRLSGELSPSCRLHPNEDALAGLVMPKNFSSFSGCRASRLHLRRTFAAPRQNWNKAVIRLYSGNRARQIWCALILRSFGKSPLCVSFTQYAAGCGGPSR